LARLLAGHEAVVLALNEVIQASRRPPPEPVAPVTDVVAAVRERSVFWSVLAEDTHRVIHVHAGGRPLMARIERRELDATLDALLGNLFAHTPDGVTAWIGVTLGTDGRVVLTVEDDGPGFPAPDVARRGRSHGASTGLGLDIARRGAERSGGRMVLGVSSGGGARIELHLGGLDGPGPA
jgi:signal transduction histidine kinase